jgi:hypothetical protein
MQIQARVSLGIRSFGLYLGVTLTPNEGKAHGLVSHIRSPQPSKDLATLGYHLNASGSHPTKMKDDEELESSRQTSSNTCYTQHSFCVEFLTTCSLNFTKVGKPLKSEH